MPWYVLLLSKEEDWGMIPCIVHNPSTPVDVLDEYARSRDERKRIEVARCGRIPLATLARLGADALADVREAVARNSRVPLPRLLALAKDVAEKVRIGAAGNPAMPVAVLEDMAENDPPARWGIAFNSHAPAHVLARVAREPDDDRVIWTCLAANPATPVHVLLCIANGWWYDLDPQICDKIADHPNVTAEIADLARARGEFLRDIEQELLENAIDGD